MKYSILSKVNIQIQWTEQFYKFTLSLVEVAKLNTTHGN